MFSKRFLIFSVSSLVLSLGLLAGGLKPAAAEEPQPTLNARQVRAQEIRKLTGQLRKLLVEISATKKKIADIKFATTGALVIAIPKTIYNIWRFTSAGSAYNQLRDAKPYTEGRLKEMESLERDYSSTVRQASLYGGGSAVVMVASTLHLNDLEKVLSEKEIEYNAALEALATMAMD